jgi:site-specific recombinase XerD
MNRVTSEALTRAIDGPWPGVARPAELLTEIAEWLGGYGNRATRRTYAEGLGLPVTAADIDDWRRPTGPDPDTWALAVTRYAAVVGAQPAARQPGRVPPTAPRGRFRHLHWFRWCATNGLDPCRATTSHVKLWLDTLAEAGAAPATRDRMLATVKALFTHLADAGLADGNPAALNRRRLGLAVPAASTTGTVVLTTAQVRELYAAARTPRRGASAADTARATAVVALLTLGLRVSELCGLDRTDLHVTRGRRALRVHGKGGKTRVVYLHAAAERALTDYLRERDADAGTTPALPGPAPDQPLLLTRTGHRFRRQAVSQLLHRLSSGTPVHPHALRHFYVTTAVEAGAQLVHVQADVGHTSIDTTEKVYNNAARDPSRSASDLVGDVLALGHADPVA